jgi:hypothetical protein
MKMSSKFVEIIDANDHMLPVSEANVKLEDVLADQEAVVQRSRSSTQSSSKSHSEKEGSEKGDQSSTSSSSSTSSTTSPFRRLRRFTLSNR